MSRLIVKNLPVYVTPERLREHFQQKGGPSGTITDVKVSSKRDGTSRRFGFVGFKSDEEAAAAQKWFNRTFIDSARIDVTVTEVCCLSTIFSSTSINTFFREQRMPLLHDQINVDDLNNRPLQHRQIYPQPHRSRLSKSKMQS